MAAREILPDALHSFASRPKEGVAQRDTMSLRPLSPDYDRSELYDLDKKMVEEIMLRLSKVVCQRRGLSFVELSAIQKKFLTHHRCANCGLIPLYQINLSHIKRVRCRKCRELTTFKATGKYGKLRKEIAFELSKAINGDGLHGIQ